MPLASVGQSMSWGEALRLTMCLADDPSTRIGAALAEWTHPATRELLTLMELFDLEHQVAWSQGGGKGGKPKPFPRPWDKPKSRRAKPDESLTQAEIIAALRAAGHTAPLPER